MFKKVSNTYDFIEMEKKWLKYWDEKGITKKYLNKNNSSKKYFSFMDGPITANNPMGVHHAWGRTYKDLWQRYFTLKGFKQRYQPGFDCQGLWIEVEVEKELGLKSKRDIENLVPYDPTTPNGSVEASKKASIAKFVELCKQRVYKFSKIQTEQSKRLAYFMDWDNPYLTMSDENNYLIWHFLKKCHENGWIYKGNDSVPWCPRCETAISQHEMLTEDYKEVFHESIILELPIIGRKNPTFAKASVGKEYLLVWTTTPWTIPANIAVAVDKDLKYALVEGNSGDLFWIAEDAVERV
ncbi:MAG: class I tRNA ligase family protein, partial [Nanoarchaeota archaeon]